MEENPKPTQPTSTDPSGGEAPQGEGQSETAAERPTESLSEKQTDALAETHAAPSDAPTPDGGGPITVDELLKTGDGQEPDAECPAADLNRAAAILESLLLVSTEPLPLDKARQQRARGRPVFSVPSAATNANPAPIQYHETRVVDVDPETLHANRVVARKDGDPTANVYRILRSQILRKMNDGGWSTLAICSANDGEGKSLTAANLAISLSIDVNQTVLLVDLDLRDPSVAPTFGIEPTFGLDDYLRGRVDLSKCLVNPGIERLVLLPVREPMDRSSEVLGSPVMARLAHELKHRYPDRIVIYDMPPVLRTDDCLAFMPNVDSTLFVVAEGQSSAADIQRSLIMLKDNNILGTILNRSAEQKMAAAG